MTRLGELERAVMDTAWAFAERSPGESFTARDIAATLPNHAYTTVLTVVDRLTRKGFLTRIRDGKSHHYLPTGTRESYVATLMHEALASTVDRDAALVHFAKTVTPEQATVLRKVLRNLERRADGHR